MSRDRVTVPVKTWDKKRWGDLSVFSLTHEVCGEVVYPVNEKYSFQGGHRVRLYKFKKNVHWRIPDGVELDISEVSAAPKRKQGGK